MLVFKSYRSLQTASTRLQRFQIYPTEHYEEVLKACELFANLNLKERYLNSSCPRGIKREISAGGDCLPFEQLQIAEDFPKLARVQRFDSRGQLTQENICKHFQRNHFRFTAPLFIINRPLGVVFLLDVNGTNQGTARGDHHKIKIFARNCKIFEKVKCAGIERNPTL